MAELTRSIKYVAEIGDELDTRGFRGLLNFVANYFTGVEIFTPHTELLHIFKACRYSDVLSVQSLPQCWKSRIFSWCFMPS